MPASRGVEEWGVVGGAQSFSKGSRKDSVGGPLVLAAQPCEEMECHGTVHVKMVKLVNLYLDHNLKES